MKYSLFKKCLVIGIIFLFVGASVIPIMFAQSAKPDLNDGLVGNWNFNDKSDSSIGDYASSYISNENQPPTVEITYPEGEETLSGIVIITGTADDPDPGDEIEYVEIKIDCCYWYTAMGTTSWSYIWHTTQYNNGSHAIFARSYDGELYSEIAVVYVWVDNIPDNDPPNPPKNPIPEDGELNVELNTILEWECTDPNGDDLTYNVYFDTVNPPEDLVSQNQPEPTYDPESLEFEIQYYWKIDARDSKSAETEGPVWNFTTENEPIYIPDLECNGKLSWIDVKPESNVAGNFTVENVGDPTSELFWEILEYPEWGNWTFTPSSGTNLKPEEGPVEIEVEIEAPDETNTEFFGEIKIVNSENPEDYEIIQVSLSTPRNNQYHNRPFLQFIQNHPHLFPILQRLLPLHLGLQ